MEKNGSTSSSKPSSVAKPSVWVPSSHLQSLASFSLLPMWFFFFFKQTKLIFSLLQIAADGNKGTDMQPGECQTCLEMPQPLLIRRLACSTICQGCSFIINQLGRRHELKCHQKRDNSSLLNAVQLFQGEFVNRN